MFPTLQIRTPNMRHHGISYLQLAAQHSLRLGYQVFELCRNSPSNCTASSAYIPRDRLPPTSIRANPLVRQQTVLKQPMQTSYTGQAAGSNRSARMLQPRSSWAPPAKSLGLAVSINWGISVVLCWYESYLEPHGFWNQGCENWYTFWVAEAGCFHMYKIDIFNYNHVNTCIDMCIYIYIYICL